jgi:hypothetical protein
MTIKKFSIIHLFIHENITAISSFFFNRNGPEGPRVCIKPAVGEQIQIGPYRIKKIQLGPELLRRTPEKRSRKHDQVLARRRR